MYTYHSYCSLVTSVNSPLHRKLRGSDTGRLLINLCVALLGLYIAFIFSGVASKWPAGACGFFSAVLHYFMLAYFFWTSAEALFLYFKLVKVFSGRGFFLRNYLYISMAVAWSKFAATIDEHVYKCASVVLVASVSGRSLQECVC